MIGTTKARALLKSRLTEHQVQLAKRLMGFVLWSVHSSNGLSRLALEFGADKQGRRGRPGMHHYMQHYERHFRPLHRRGLRILEIGIGGYDDPKGGGGSLRMWKAYFRRSRIFGIDIYDKTYHDESRIKTFRGSQTDAEFLRRVVAEMGGVDIVIDDGSHVNAHVITSFEVLFPLLSTNGIYVVEDTQTSYWPELGGGPRGGSDDVNAPQTSMDYFRALVDGLNFEEFPSQDYEPTYFDRHIVAMHFYHNLVFVQKGLNNEGGGRAQYQRYLGAD